MSDEDFLKRWSRRKREANSEAIAPVEVAPPVETPPVETPAAEERTAAEALPPAAEPELDLSNLPPIDSITATTDVTAFLRENIPLELSRAALRRAWVSDPAIRDFVGLAENAWDFTDPTAMPGFGPLDQSPEQIAAMVERVVGGFRDTAERIETLAGDEIPAENAVPPTASVSQVRDETADEMSASQEDDADTDAATQPEASESEIAEADVPAPRTHGGALPR
jgi:hypothetical protein